MKVEVRESSEGLVAAILGCSIPTVPVGRLVSTAMAGPLQELSGRVVIV